MRRPANDGNERPVLAPAQDRLHLDDRVIRRVGAKPAERFLLRRRDPDRPAELRGLAAVRDVLRIPGVHERRRESEHQDGRRQHRRVDGSHPREHAGQQDRDRDEQHLPGPESDPRQLRRCGRSRAGTGPARCPAAAMVTGLGLVRNAISPASAGTSTGPSESSSVTTGLLRENPANPTSSAEPAPSITRLAAPHPTASTTGTAASSVPGDQAPASRLPDGIDAHTEAVDGRTDDAKQWIERGRQAERETGAGDRRDGRRVAPASAATSSPVSPRAIAVVCCGVYHRERGTLSMRRPDESPGGDRVDVRVEQSGQRPAPREQGDDLVRALGARGQHGQRDRGGRRAGAWHRGPHQQEQRADHQHAAEHRVRLQARLDVPKGRQRAPFRQPSPAAESRSSSSSWLSAPCRDCAAAA